MANKMDKEKLKNQQDKAQAILSRLLKDDDNKYCVDCDAKGPRWASWNLGIFLCIRCAGIHRNLGAHISKVKSVNLDSWTPEQISMVMEIGNSRARAVYEANIPDGFRRPQTDSSLEAFVRSKYEHKKYIAREWIPPIPKVPKEFYEDDSKKKTIKKNTSSMIQLSTTSLRNKAVLPNGSIKESGSAPSKLSEMGQPTKKDPSPASVDDLLGLDSPEKNPDSVSTASFLNDILNQTPPLPVSSSNTVTSPPTSQPQIAEDQSADEPVFDNTAHSMSTKESIMALYGSGSNQQMYNAPSMFGVPGSNQQPQQVSSVPNVYMGMNQGQMYTGVVPGMHPHMVPGNPNMAPVNPNMVTQQAGVMPMQSMYAAQPVSAMPAGMMYNNNNYQMQQFQYNQMQQQMAGLNVGVPSMNASQGQVHAQMWQPTSSTLSTNLWR